MIASIRPMLAVRLGPVARGSIQSLAIRLSGLGLSFAQGVLAARLLGIEGYGIAAVALSLGNVLATLALFGWGPLAVQKLAQFASASRLDTIARFVRDSSRRVFALAIALGGLLAAIALAGLAPPAYRGAILAAGLVVVPMSLLQLQRGIAQGLGRVAVAQVPGELLRPALIVSFLAVGLSLRWQVGPQLFVAAFAGAALIAIVLSLPSTVRGLPVAMRSERDRAQRRTWQSEAMPFLGIMLIGMLLAEVTTLLLGWLATPAEAGLFQPIARLVPLMVLPAQAVAVSFAPRIAELWAQGEQARVERLTHSFTLVTSAMTAGLVGLLILCGPLIMWAFGPQFMPGAALLWIVGIAQLINAAVGPVGHLLAMTGHASKALRGQSVALAANLLVGAALIPLYGALGAAIAMAVGLAVWNVTLLFGVRKLLGLDPSLLGALRGLIVRR